MRRLEALPLDWLRGRLRWPTAAICKISLMAKRGGGRMCAQTIEVERDEERKGKERKTEAQQNATYLPRQPRGRVKENEEVGGVVRTKRESETSLLGKVLFLGTGGERGGRYSVVPHKGPGLGTREGQARPGYFERVFSSSTGMTTEGCKELPKVGTSSRSRFREDLWCLILSGRGTRKGEEEKLPDVTTSASPPQDLDLGVGCFFGYGPMCERRSCCWTFLHAPN